jgi:hypothetical protein
MFSGTCGREATLQLCSRLERRGSTRRVRGATPVPVAKGSLRFSVTLGLLGSNFYFKSFLALFYELEGARPREGAVVQMDL